MSKKITWDMIYKDFKQRHPRLAKMISYWYPYDYLTIMLYMDDGTKIEYDYFYHKGTFSSDRWK